MVFYGGGLALFLVLSFALALPVTGTNHGHFFYPVDALGLHIVTWIIGTLAGPWLVRLYYTQSEES
jgi:hypothetical protein